jgi:hypothetical protein
MTYLMKTPKRPLSCSEFRRTLSFPFDAPIGSNAADHAIDSRCPRCGSDLEIVAAVLDPKQIARYLVHAGMATAPPAVRIPKAISDIG